ncbi:hypothetical protein EUGRSUZ_K01096 [Eucalyptus grandis]|uniref:Uncharacterized protein n=2 Tax=Eucalyptus grandis TaxID=71139 RepID=A0ACC3IS95_EUCGR|nr:hypothetical protein EUGRSUZ_K01096 [Eucalyptus grandis]
MCLIWSPEITARTSPTVKMVESHVISHNNLPPNNVRYGTHERVTVFTYPEVLHYPDRAIFARIQQPKCQSQLFTMSHQYSLLVVLAYIISH